ncbi:hypothetical protein ONZ45_g7347 [Pleurotus djamor]|nr:hypothetical protein ONZ45_g7347 [Pleurotus djamor]
MTLRQIISSSVLLACVLYVYASPIILTDDVYDVEAPSYGTASESLQPGGLPYADNYYFPEEDDVFPLNRRGRGFKVRPPKKQPSVPVPVIPKIPSVPAPANGPAIPQQKPSTPAPAPPPAPVPIGPIKKPTIPGPTIPQRKPPVAVPAPIPALPNKKPSSPRPASNAPNPAPKPPLGDAQKPGTLPAGAPQPARTPPKQKLPENHAACAVQRRGILIKRVFSTSCPTASLTLGGVTRPIVKIRDEDQGKSAITHSVSGGWPDHSTGQYVPAFAKTGRFPNHDFSREAASLHQVGQLLAEGQYDGRSFIVLRGIPGMKIFGTQYYGRLYYHYLQRGDIEGCKAEVRQSLIPLIVQDVQRHVNQFRLFHTDIHPDNVLFDESVSPMMARLIDWGKAEQQPVWTANLADRARIQADRMFLESDDTKICQ